MAAGLKSLLGRKMTKKVKFMNEDIEISKLSVTQVLEIQEMAKKSEATGTNENGLDLLKTVIKQSVAGADELSDDDFDSFPMDELSKLSNEIMKYSGIGGDQGK